MLAYRICLAAIAILSFLIYGIAIRKVFSREHGVDWRMRALQIAGILFALTHVWCLWRKAVVPSINAFAAFAIYIGALVIFFSARSSLRGYRLTLAFSPDIPQRIVRTGIYARVRHPFYLAYVLTWIAGVIAAPMLATFITTACMMAFYVCAARIEESKFAGSSLAPAYDAYKRRSGLLWPKI